MSNSKSTISIDQLVSRIVRLQDPETDNLFGGDPASFDVADLEFIEEDVERRLFLARKNQAAAAEVEKLTKEMTDLETLIKFADQLQTYLKGLAQADFQGRPNPTLVFEHSFHPGDIYQHPDSRIVKYSAHAFASESYGIEIVGWDLPAPTRSADTASIGQLAPTDQSTIPAANSAQTEGIPEIPSTESNTLLLTLSWCLDIYMEKKQPNWKECILDPSYTTSTSLLRTGRLNVDAVSQSLAAEIDMTGDIVRAVKTYVKMARDVILGQGPIQAPLSPRQVKGAYRALYGLARLTLRTLLVDDQKFAKLENTPQSVASFINGKLAPPEPLTKDRVTACLSECWEIVTEMIREKRS